MPIYEYHCEKCDKTTELTHGMSEKRSPKCPKCGKKMERIISRNSFQLKGSGWYKTDYPKKSGPDKKGTASTKSETKTETKAETKSDTKAGD